MFSMKNSRKNNNGLFMTIAPFVIIVLLGFSALVVDIGILRVSRNELQTATDAAALAAANALINGNDAAIDAANNIITQNSIIGNVSPANVNIQLGTWDSDNRTFTENEDAPTAARVTADVTPSMIFANFFSTSPHTITTESTAALLGGPRDIIFIVDLTPAMNQYSQFSAYPTLSIAQITANIQEIYNALGLPQLGAMTFTPIFLTGSNSSILTSLGLNGVAYPYPAGSWTGYINYVKNDSSLAAAGYANQYGYLTFVNYLLSQEPQHSQTPTLWQTPEQPLQEVKDSINSFVDTNLSESDRIALISYNATNGNTAVIEQSLTNNFSLVTDTLAVKQAAHYASGVNMLSAISTAVNELNGHGRQDAQWIIYLLTAAQLSNAGQSAILNQVQSAANSNITINTITVGANGNMTLMQEIAQITNGTSVQISPDTDFGDTLGQIASMGGKAQVVQ